MRLGFIGLGVMGRPMAQHLLRAGHAMAVYARRPEAAAALVAAGAIACASPRELASRAEIVFTMVTSSADVRQVTLGANGLIEAVATHRAHFSTLVDMSTIAPAAAREIAAELGARGIDMLDAPVSGGEQGAVEGTLAIMAGGATDVFERVRPLFAVLGKTLVHVGPAGTGQVAKACNQIVMVAAIEACAESLLLASRSGVEPAKVRQALQGGSAASRVLDVIGQRMVERDFHAGIEARLHHKDFGLLMAEATRAGIPLALSAQVAQQLNALMGNGWGKDDTSSLLRVLERQCGGSGD